MIEGKLLTDFTSWMLKTYPDYIIDVDCSDYFREYDLQDIYDNLPKSAQRGLILEFLVEKGYYISIERLKTDWRVSLTVDKFEQLGGFPTSGSGYDAAIQIANKKYNGE